MRTLVVDNIDSFVYILFQYVGELGGDPLVVDNRTGREEVDRLMSEEDIGRIIISPGPKRPEDAGISNYVITKYGVEVPLLGVCLGHQCIGHCFGAEVRNAKTLMHGKTSRIEHDGSGVLVGMPNPFEATRYHSLVVDNLPEELIKTAASLDDGEVMALKHRDYPIYGVQFHPESILTSDGKRIIENFLGDGL
ncbi:MAG: anthranilate/aminodeoxychorismate synthase component II [Candidatus Altiarchaeales archaeon]|nr:anthranilate/aminodeoxychorismate synthase component II [Candidatus Altiarchaeales archaeon]MBD3415937.1 anthranilate/aminodeoxychorismate synthase component II [Candidatus Altiarchaeales archaeon]